MAKIKGMAVYLIIAICAFYLLPLIIKDTGSAMFVLLMAMPFIIFISSFFYGLFNGINLVYVLIIAVLFIPTVYIFYNLSAFVYFYIFGIVALVGNLIGGLVNKFKNKG